MGLSKYYFIIVGLLAVSLTACGGQNFGLQNSSPKTGDEEAVHLGANGAPLKTSLMKAGPLGEKWLGSTSAKVTVIEYMSLTCPHCRAFHQKTFPRFKRDYIDTGKVRYIVREFPIGRSSGNAALITRCGTKDRTFKMIDLFLNNQKKWASQDVRLDAIFSVAKQSGITRAEFDNCLKNQELIDGLNWVKERGRKLGVSGTPTFFINSEKVRRPLTFEELRKLLEPHLSSTS